ncbi:M20/M25/M40 family metallo-hydrolase [Actinomadura soli]|uniref:M20/M25/M40 family metallo-hydrolase n=2 Tax=Actinomadura soli TaxID=2508997 RepID=A0A5C4IYD3_9ACTN|nr:M20/M25/M40 family metallo-hydrolase [Actinomadura soli]
MAAPAMTSTGSSQAPGADPKAAAMASADRLIAGNAADLYTGQDEKYVRTQVVGTPWDQYYVAYERTYRGLPVVGGDFVIATDGKGRVRTLSVAQNQQITVGTTPKVTDTAAAGRSRTALTKPDKAELKPRLVVHALAKPRLAWETVVSGRDGEQPSRKKVYIDALTGKRFDAQETIQAGTGTGIWGGPNLTFGTTQSGGTYSMRDPNRAGLTCADFSGNRIFTGPDDVWGTASKTDKESGCVDVMYSSAGFWDLLKSFGRTGLRNNQWAPARVGLNAVNAYWNGTDAQFGHNQRNQWITSTDVVAHEFGHGLDNFTPGGMSGGGTQEFVGDVWGAVVEHALNNPADTPDYTVGELVDLVGRGPIRNMYNPSQVNNDPNCYSASVPRMEVHKAAGPGNHWFYLLAEGSQPGGGKPNSPVCQGGQLTGIGVMNAAKIFYNAMMLKTSGTSYARYRTLTLTAAKNLDATCESFNKVKAAWDAVQLGAQSGEPTCTPGANNATAYTVGGGSHPKAAAAPDINVESVKAHLQQFQTIASSNGGSRRSTGPGYTASVSYIEQKLKAAGFTVARQACASGCSGGAGPNLVADWPGGNDNNVYMFGAHLDSVAAGPGINDNGTGSAAQLEVALQLAQSKPTMLNHVRFAWWTDEEQGLRGSKYYVSRLSAADRSKIKGYFNFDMVGSPNPGYFIDDINSPLAKNLKEYFDSINVPTEEVAECCSDDGSFRSAGIATTFLFTGAPARKSAAQAQKWGGTANQAFDRCYHQACDSYPGNINTTALDRCSDAIAYALWKVAVGAQRASGNGKRS